jgi:hypothetical protein
MYSRLNETTRNFKEDINILVESLLAISPPNNFDKFNRFAKKNQQDVN